MFLFKLGIFNFDIASLISFLVGLVVGAAILCLIYALLVVASIGDKKFLVKTEEDNLTTEEVKDMIITAQKTFKDKSLRGDLSKAAFCKNLCKDLTYGIATRYYPNSKYPLLELSVDETIMLVGYIQKRVDEILNKKAIKLLRKLKISSIVDLTQKTTTVVESKAFQIGKNVNNVLSKIKKVVNVINPVTWFRKLVVDQTMNIIINKLCLIIIAIVGEETYKIYSKTVFNEEVNVESNINELLDSLDTELIEVKKMNEDDFIASDTNLNDLKLKRKVFNKKIDSYDYKPIFDSNKNLKYKKETVLIP